MGKMQLEGKEIPLKKPLAVMSLVKPEDGSTEYHVAGVVRKKVVFRNRPAPVTVEPTTVGADRGAVGTKRMRSEAQHGDLFGR